MPIGECSSSYKAIVFGGRWAGLTSVGNAGWSMLNCGQVIRKIKRGSSLSLIPSDRRELVDQAAVCSVHAEGCSA